MLVMGGIIGSGIFVNPAVVARNVHSPGLIVGVWILGGLIVKGKTVVKITNGSAVLLYSAEAMQQNITKYGGNMRTIAWKEL